MEAGTVGVHAGAPSAPAGWYSNPEGSGQRYWTGSEWGEIHVENVASGGPQNAASTTVASVIEGQPQSWWVAVIAAAGMIIGGFGPWATALGFVSVNGTHGDGWLVIAAGVVGLVVLWKNAQSRRAGSGLILAALAGVGAAVVTIADLGQIEGREGVEPAWGIYAAMFGGMALAVAAIALYRARSAERVAAE
jgi:hypothetical protein